MCFKCVSSRRMQCVCVVCSLKIITCVYRHSVNAKLHLPMPLRLKWVSNIVCTHFLCTTLDTLRWYANICVVIGCSSIGNVFASVQVRYRWWSILPIELLTESISFYFFIFYWKFKEGIESRLSFDIFAVFFCFLSFIWSCSVDTHNKDWKWDSDTAETNEFVIFPQKREKVAGNLDIIHNMYTEHGTMYI